MNRKEIKAHSPVFFIFTIIFLQLLYPSTQAKSLCVGLEGNNVDCPLRSESIDRDVKAFIDECKKFSQAKVDVDDKSSCFIFPANLENETLVSCDASSPCTHGYIIRSTGQARGINPTGLVFISVKFFGIIQPVPALMSIQQAYEVRKRGKEPYCFGNATKRESKNMSSRAKRKKKNPTDYDVTEWLALGISEDIEMGNDLIIHCNPFMDKMARKCGHNFVPINEEFYPDEIGIGINKPYTFSHGKQAYEAERIFSTQRGNIINGKVKYTPSATNKSYGFLECSADISTFILLQSRGERTTGIEIDMEKQTKAHVLIATGACLVRDCLGDVEENELRDVARRTSVLAKHRRVHISLKKEILFDAHETNGAGIIGLNYVKVSFLCWLLLQIV